jgi:hypothetical protein
VEVASHIERHAQYITRERRCVHTHVRVRHTAGGLGRGGCHMTRTRIWNKLQDESCWAKLPKAVPPEA